MALDDVSSSGSDFEAYSEFRFLLLGEAIGNVLGVARHVELVYDPYSRARSVLTVSSLLRSEPSLASIRGRGLRGGSGERQLISMKLFRKGDEAVEIAPPIKDRG